MVDKIKMNEKFILMDLDDERSKKIAEVLGNKTCRRILDFLAETREASEKDISLELKTPINTIEYNLNKLVKVGLVDKSKNFFWSVKGRRIAMFKLAKKHIIISPKKKRPDMNVLKSILPILMIAVAALIVAVLLSGNSPIVDETQLKQFLNQDELTAFLNQTEDYGYYGDERMMMNTGGAVPMMATAEVDGSSAKASDFSTTNIQIEGVDEPDFVKNDDKYIYVVSGNKLIIVNAYPAENMEILSEIEFNENTTISELFINDDKLVVFGSRNEYIYYDEACALEAEAADIEFVSYYSCGGYSRYDSLVNVYDISDKENPELEDEIEVEGSYVDSRMIGDYVYVISNKNAGRNNPVPPIYKINGVETIVSAEDVSYWDYPDSSYYFTSISAINLKNNEFNNEVYLTGYSGTIFVSQDNIYLTQTKTIRYQDYYADMIKEVILPLLPPSEDAKIQVILDSDSDYYDQMIQIEEIYEEYSNKLNKEARVAFQEQLEERAEDFQAELAKRTEKTRIHKINIKEDKITYQGVGEAPGHILNQFSMDEYDGNFRIATTTGNTWGGNSLNHLYILDEDLEIVGSVEDLAQGEQIYSVRFMGKRAYIVTFKKIDPLFVIDVEDPENPEVLGYLKITGYSDYLHPYDENHVIGIGKETAGGNEDFSWYQGIKVSLFDVSDVNNPVEKAKIEIGDRGTDSAALRDHKAVLFDRERNLLVLPISLYEVDESDYSRKVPDNAYGQKVWEGAYVLNIDLNGISIRGKITHNDELVSLPAAEDELIGATREDAQGNIWTKIAEEQWTTDAENYEESTWGDYMIDGFPSGIYDYNKFSYAKQIQRSLFMDDVLYTISLGMIKANNLQTMHETNSLDLGYEYNYPYYYGREVGGGIAI